MIASPAIVTTVVGKGSSPMWNSKQQICKIAEDEYFILRKTKLRHGWRIFNWQSLICLIHSTALDHGPLHVYYLFHANGIRVVEPDSCGFKLNVPTNHVLPKPHGVLCPMTPSGDTACSWGDAVNVNNQYIYVTQPMNNRIIMIDIRTQQIIEVS